MILALFACAVSNPVLLDVPVTASATLPEGITLTTASLTVSDVQFESPATARARPVVFPGALLVGRAEAHPGHDFDGGVAGELLGSWTLDLLGGPTLLGDARLYDGDYATARLLLTGTASFAGTTADGAAFALDAAIEDDVTGIPFVASISGEAPPARLGLTVDVAHLLSFVSFGDTDGDAIVTTADGDTASTFRFGVTATPTFSLSVD